MPSAALNAAPRRCNCVIQRRRLGTETEAALAVAAQHGDLVVDRSRLVGKRAGVEIELGRAPINNTRLGFVHRLIAKKSLRFEAREGRDVR